ncbi:MAG: AtpZ/AtpI family protein [Parachlamydiales bacterium]
MEEDQNGKKKVRFEEKKKSWSILATPFVLVAPLIIGYFFGDWLDGYLGTGAIFTYIFLALGFFAGFRELYMIIKKTSNDE